MNKIPDTKDKRGIYPNIMANLKPMTKEKQVHGGQTVTTKRRFIDSGWMCKECKGTGYKRIEGQTCSIVVDQEIGHLRR